LIAWTPHQEAPLVEKKFLRGKSFVIILLLN